VLTFEVSPASPTEVQADLLILPMFEGRVPGPGVKAVGQALDTDLSDLLKTHGGRGKLGETCVVPALGKIRPGSIMLVGLGPKDSAGATAVRKAAMKAGRAGGKFATVASTLAQVGGDPQDSAQAFAEGVTLGAYRFDRYKHEPLDEASKERPRLKRVLALADGERAAVKAGLSRGEIYSEAGNWARDLVNTPAIDATPSYLADQARAIAKELGLTVKIWSKAELAKGGFGGILGVGAGSVNDPRLIELSYKGGGQGFGPPIAITGKGVTFDSGGLSLKPAEAMEWMKADMGGAAATLAAMRAIGRLQPKVDVIAAIPSAENLPGGSAIRPGDVLRHRGGKTSEVLNTDAEGRLILADALAYLAEKKPRVIIDSATLTGAAMIALGIDVWAVMGSDRKLIADLIAAGEAEGEPGWELPLWTDYRRHIESSVADVKNVGIRWGGAITAGLFLKEFVGDVPWAHIDVAGTAFAEQSGEYWPRGATGSPARTLVRYIEDQAAAKPARRPTPKRTTRRRG
jgi:leucyl aminopeptidase